MLEQIAPLWDVFLQNKKQKQSLVLAIIVKTQGSSYKKQGAMALIDQELRPHGLISGGCLENDLAQHAESLFDVNNGQDSIKNNAKLVEYDLSDDSIFGLGAGCDGQIQIQLLLMNPENDYQPFSLLNPNINQAEPANLRINSNIDSNLFAEFQYHSKSLNLNSQSQIDKDIKINPNDYCNLEFTPSLKIAIVGTGTDIQPICQQIQFMNWHACVLDHRVQRLNNFPKYQNIETLVVDLKNKSSMKDLAENIDAVLLATHNIDKDAEYLAFFDQFNIAYIGLLGPINRRDKVLAKARINLQELNNKLYAPVGLDLACNSPEQIALSIIAELQLELNQQRKVQK